MAEGRPYPFSRWEKMAEGQMRAMLRWSGIQAESLRNPPSSVGCAATFSQGEKGY
jgi:hypothetical protein